MSNVVVRSALLSVSEKSGLADFARALRELGVSLLSTGGTREMLGEQGIEVREVSDYTGFPEMMDGRVKTLHPKIHGGLLGRHESDGSGPDDRVMVDQGIDPIDLLVVNLYPFERVVADPSCDLDTAIENIDIGGPAMLRSAAKNFQRVAVIVDAGDYQAVLDELKSSGGALGRETRFRLALKAFEHVARYDAAISNYLGSIDPAGGRRISAFPHTLTWQFVKRQEMRYGENPHQQAAFYVESEVSGWNVSTARQVHGKALSYNNIADTDAALECVKSFSDPACVIVKHANPCGVAEADSLQEAWEMAFATDPASAFGGIIAFNDEVDAELAREIIDRQFVEVIAAPGFSDGALQELKKKKNVRVLTGEGGVSERVETPDLKKVGGGLLVQSRDVELLDDGALKVVTTRSPTSEERRDLLFAWKVAKFVKSNAIVYARNRRTIGIGAGQMSRVYSARIAGIKAADEGLEVLSSVMASDAFFPFRDGIDAAARAGIRAVIQPGGSVRDEEVIDAANEADMAMMFTGMRHFRH